MLSESDFEWYYTLPDIWKKELLVNLHDYRWDAIEKRDSLDIVEKELSAILKLESFSIGLWEIDPPEEEICDLTPLCKLKHLRFLESQSTKVIDLSPLSECENICVLFLHHASVNSLRVIWNLKLDRLDITDTSIEDSELVLYKEEHPDTLVTEEQAWLATYKSERQLLLESLSETIADYRLGDLDRPTPEHVERWVNQFSADRQIAILREMDNVLKNTYFSLEKVTNFLKKVLNSKKLVGEEPCQFWRAVHFLDIQGGGNSQHEMLAIFGQLLEDQCGFGTNQQSKSPQAYIYLDDAIFTGNRILRDLESWIRTDAPANATVHVVTIALHSGGQYYANSRIQQVANEIGKSIDISWWREIELEDRRAYSNSADVLRPVSIPDIIEVQNYVNAMRYQPTLRTPGNIGTNGLFSGEEGRNLLEQEFLIAGVKIRNMCPYLGVTQRPLGHISLETLGFGSLIVTFRNCPNNAPLALWAGDPWYPLLPRTTNSQTSLKRFLSLMKEDGFGGF